MKRFVLFLFLVPTFLMPLPLIANGFSFSNSGALESAEAEVTSASGVTCVVPTSTGAHIDMGMYGENSPVSSYTPGPSVQKHGVFVRLVIPLGANKMAKLNCKEVLDLEIKKLRLEYRLLLEQINKIKED